MENKKKNDPCKKIKEDLLDMEGKYKRALADYHNLSRKASEEKIEFFKYSLEKFFLEILPIYDNLRMAIDTLNDGEKNNPWVEGVTYVIKQFQESFENNGLKQIQTVGQSFDYNIMEAVKGDGDIVKKEVRPGYTLNGKVIIPAKVVVFPKEEENNNN